MKRILLLIFCISIANPVFADCLSFMLKGQMDTYNDCVANRMRMQQQDAMMQEQLNLQRQQVQMQQQWMNQQQSPWGYQNQPIIPPMRPSVYY